jgi:hypothetical protein
MRCNTGTSNKLRLVGFFHSSTQPEEEYNKGGPGVTAMADEENTVENELRELRAVVLVEGFARRR